MVRTFDILVPNLSGILFPLVYGAFWHLLIHFTYSLTLLSPLFPGVPEPSVVIYVVKNASRPVSGEDSPVPDGKRFSFLCGLYCNSEQAVMSLFESIVVFVAKQEGIGVETFSLSRVRRYYETGVKSLLGEALIEYGFPTDAIRRIEENHKKIKSMTVSEAKEYCRLHFREVQLLLDTYERSLFIKAMRTF